MHKYINIYITYIEVILDKHLLQTIFGHDEQTRIFVLMLPHLNIVKKSFRIKNRLVNIESSFYYYTYVYIQHYILASIINKYIRYSISKYTTININSLLSTFTFPLLLRIWYTDEKCSEKYTPMTRYPPMTISTNYFCAYLSF